MKTTIRLFVIIAFFAFGGIMNAQTLRTQTPVEKKEEPSTKPEYERALKHYAEWKTRFNDLDYWKNVILTRVSDNKQFKIKDLNERDRNSFYLSNLRRLGFEMNRLNGFWEEEAKKYAANPPNQKDVPTVEDLKEYIDRLTNLRKESAQVLESYAEKLLKDNPKEFTKEEGEQILKSIREFHDDNKLIERKRK